MRQNGGDLMMAVQRALQMVSQPLLVVQHLDFEIFPDSGGCQPVRQSTRHCLDTETLILDQRRSFEVQSFCRSFKTKLRWRHSAAGIMRSCKLSHWAEQTGQGGSCIIPSLLELSQSIRFQTIDRLHRRGVCTPSPAFFICCMYWKAICSVARHCGLYCKSGPWVLCWSCVVPAGPALDKRQIVPFRQIEYTRAFPQWVRPGCNYHVLRRALLPVITHL